MINKINKIINNKFSRFFKFIFFLRYLFVIFFVAIIVFLSIPHFFNYKKNELIIDNYLSKNFGIKISEISDIEFSSFPIPHLQLSNVVAGFYSEEVNLETKTLQIYPKLFNIYNFENLQVKKIKLEDSYLKTDLQNIKVLAKNISVNEKRIQLKNLNLKIKDNKSNIIDIKKVNYFNYGYKKNKIEGEIFDRKFNLKMLSDFKDINFNFLDIGIFVNLKILKNYSNSKFAGSIKGGVLQSDFKLDFIYEGDFITINNFYFRDKKLSFDSDGTLKLKPFSSLFLNSEIKNFDKKIIKNLNLNSLLKSKDFIKKLNSQNNINFVSQKFSRDLIDNLNIKSNLAYGRLNFIKSFSISKTDFFCRNNLNLLDEYPIMYFNCSINSNDTKKFFKRIKVKNKLKNKTLKIEMQGNLNILNKKINFDKIKVNDNYDATREDLKYYKITFEDKMFDENFINIFDLSKIKEFIYEIN